MHTDKKNLGPSAIIGLGDYQDGKLWGCASPAAPCALASLPLPSICGQTHLPVARKALALAARNSALGF